MQADVIVVSWNRCELLSSCLEHLERQTERHRVILVDNASDDGTVEHVHARFPDVTIVKMPRNVGFGAAVNAGARVGEGEAIVLVNNDMDADRDFVAEILEPLRGDPMVGMVAGMMLRPGRDAVDAFGIQLDRGLAAYGGLRNRRPDEPTGVLAGACGGAAAYRRTAYEQVGGFDERLFAYGEDADLALRLRVAGWKSAAAPDARGVHLGGASFGVDSPWQRWLGGFARGFMLRKWRVVRSRAALRVLAAEALVVGWGLARHRTIAPLRARMAGWRAARGETFAVPSDAIDHDIDMLESIRRLRTMR
jgi:N-acetylglucosaminyl-diphospho-decaprenol L-rhamnosyltransferase